MKCSLGERASLSRQWSLKRLCSRTTKLATYCMVDLRELCFKTVHNSGWRLLHRSWAWGIYSRHCHQFVLSFWREIKTSWRTLVRGIVGKAVMFRRRESSSAWRAQYHAAVSFWKSQSLFPYLSKSKQTIWATYIDDNFLKKVLLTFCFENFPPCLSISNWAPWCSTEHPGKSQHTQENSTVCG